MTSCSKTLTVPKAYGGTSEVGETSEEAGTKYHRIVTSPSFIEAALSLVVSVTDVDFSQFGLDEPLLASPPMTSRARSTNSCNGQ